MSVLDRRLRKATDTAPATMQDPRGAAAEQTFTPSPINMGAAGAPIPDNGWAPAPEAGASPPQADPDPVGSPTASGGLNEGLAQFQKWVLNFAEVTNPFAKWAIHPVHISEESDPQDGQDAPTGDFGTPAPPERYQASLSAPPDFDYNQTFPLHSVASSAMTKALLAAHWEGYAQVYPGIRELVAPPRGMSGLIRLEKKVSGALPEGGRWITVHPHHDPDEKGHPIYIVPNPDGSHSVVAGAGGKLNGLRLHHVKSPEEYKRYAQTQQAEKQRSKELAAEARKKEVGLKQYVEEVKAKEAAAKEAKEAKVATERQYVQDVLSARGHDTSIMDIPKEQLAGMTDRQKERIQNEHHRALVSYADAVANGVESKLRAGWGDAMLQSSDLTAGDIIGQLAAARGKGYQAGISELAQERGLDATEAAGAAREASWRRLLDKSGGDVEGAQSAKQSIERRTQAAARARQDTKEAAGRLGATGVGPEAVKRLSEEPDEETMDQAASILAARKKMLDSRKRLRELSREIDSADDISRLPRGMAVVAQPMDDAAALDAVAHDLDQANLTHRMNELIKTSNSEELAPGIGEHLSVGHNAALGTIMAAALPGVAQIDPLVHDTLGVAVAAHAIARRVAAAGDTDNVRGALERVHVATQAQIAQEGTKKAQELLAAAAEIPDVPVAEHAEGLAGALLDLEHKEALLDSARSAAGVARGRVEATSAVIAAMQGIGQLQDGSVLTTLGQLSPAEAIEHLAAVGLTKPDRTDGEGNVVEPGDYLLHHDGKNAIVEVHPQGLDKLIAPEDTELANRAERSRAIKRGILDDPSFFPAGITRRVATSMDFKPEQFVQTGHVLQIPEGTSDKDLTDLISEHIGARIQEGQDPFDVLASVSSASFVAGLGLSPDSENRYRAAIHALAPAAPSYPAGATVAQKGELAKAHRADVRARLVGLAESYVKAQKERGLLSEDEAALDSQHVPINPTTRDLVYQAALADPRTRFAFHDVGDLGREGREAIRSYAYEKVLGIDPKSDEIITPLSPDERKGFEAWQSLKDGGEPYAQIQDMWKRSAEQDSGLFGDPEIPALATVDMKNQVELLAAMRSDPRALGFMPDSPEIHAGEFSAEVPDPDNPGGKKVVKLQRTDDDIARVCRQRLKKILHKKFFELSGHPDLAATAFNPSRVVTASGRWKDYYRAVGNEHRAMQTIQELMAGDVSARFAAMYQQKTGKPLTVANRTLEHADKHAKAMLPQELRQEEDSSPKALQALMQKTGPGGRFGRGEVKSRLEASQLAANTQLDLIDRQGEGAERNVETSRPSLGKMAEGALRQMLPHMDVNRAQEAATDVSWSDENGVKLQRATRLILENKKQGLNLQAGSGKTLSGLAAFTQAHHDGEASRMLYITPSNVVEQVGGECWKFIDPEAGLRWHANGGASPEERHTAYADPDTHIVVTTAESLREDITGAVAADLGISKADAVLKLGELDDDGRDALIHGAMDRRGWNFDFSTFDEGHRLLGREGKPDATMAHVADSVGRRSTFNVYSTGDPVKNDPSEAWSALNKLDPKRYPPGSRAAFMRRFGRNTRAARTALQREVEPYLYSERTNIGVNLDTQTHILPLSPTQQEQYDRIMGAYQAARSAKAQGGIDMGALASMFPEKFTGDPQADQLTAEKLNMALGALRDAALARVVHSGDGVKGDKAVELTRKHVEQGDGVTIFARNLETVGGIAQRLKDAGLSVATLTGSMSGKEKARAIKGFSPPGWTPEGTGVQPHADVIVMSDAGAMGANLQRGNVQIQVDTPQTAMLKHQRTARNWRRGQKRAVLVHELVGDAPMEHRARQRLVNKDDLREIMNSPAEEIDDSGLLLDIERGRNQRAER